MFSSMGYLALAALPGIAALYSIRPRVRVRRVGGLFLWSGAAATTPAKPTRTRAIGLDLAAAALFILLAFGFASPVFDTYTSEWWLLAAMRGAVCAVITAVLVFLWRSQSPAKPTMD